jgi:hypothetical protein
MPLWGEAGVVQKYLTSQAGKPGFETLFVNTDTILATGERKVRWIQAPSRHVFTNGSVRYLGTRCACCEINGCCSSTGGCHSGWRPNTTTGAADLQGNSTWKLKYPVFPRRCRNMELCKLLFFNAEFFINCSWLKCLCCRRVKKKDFLGTAIAGLSDQVGEYITISVTH